MATWHHSGTHIHQTQSMTSCGALIYVHNCECVVRLKETGYKETENADTNFL